MQRWGHSSTPESWSGLDMFKDHQLRYDDPNRLRGYENFKQNLNDILHAGTRRRRTGYFKYRPKQFKGLRSVWLGAFCRFERHWAA